MPAPVTSKKRLTPRTVEQREQDEFDEREPDELPSEEEEEEEEGVYLASAQTDGCSLDHTNQTPRYADELYLTAEAARERMLLENHRQRMSFMEHMVVQTPENINQQLQKMEPDMADKMQQLQTISAQRVLLDENRKKGQETNKRRAEERRLSESI